MNNVPLFTRHKGNNSVPTLFIGLFNFITIEKVMFTDDSREL